MEELLTGLQITDEEEEAWQLYRDSNLQQLDYDLCLVEFFLTASVVHFLAIQNMLANLWHPIRGVQISNRGHGDSFCPARLRKNFKETEIGWDISLRASRRRAITTRNALIKVDCEPSFPNRFPMENASSSTPPPALFDLAPLALSQTVASEASASSPAPSTQLTPPTIAAFSA
ncbi:hypothetical protein Goshw_005409 [Gossypium schwendimanii]|uniref:Uncharacterized protein n=1 Tax=Gossypium schwendimanii TaxID=34291 RepID=A0A7J9L143_GOSSC|nr:hypothetical protein [Gossypium schwendimanii]